MIKRKIFENCTALGKVINKPNIQISFLSYLLRGSKNILIDTVPQKVSDSWMNELSELLEGESMDALILNHSEEDHSGALGTILQRFPNVIIYCTNACQNRLKTTYPNTNFVNVEHGASIQIGEDSFRFIHTPGLHWDDNMVTLLENQETLFSNDLFGQYLGCMDLTDDNLSADEVLLGADLYFEKVFASASEEQKRVIAEVEKLNIQRIAPGHGVVVNKSLQEMLDLYNRKCL